MEFGEAQALKVADEALFARTGEHLSDIETIVLQGSWRNQKYQDIAREANFNEDYIRGTIGQELWRKLSEALGEKVEKRNFRSALERRWSVRQNLNPTTIAKVKPEIKNVTNFRELERPQVESLVYQALSQPGCLLRIKAPWQMGKTSLMAKGLSYLRLQGYRTARLSLRLAEASDFASLENFLLWFCTSATEILGEENRVEHHWRNKLGNNKVKCMTYFETYLLAPDRPLAIALDDADRIFPYAQIAGEFLGILRAFHEQAKTRPSWQKLALILVHTEVYDRLQINQSPFNVGVQINVPEFSLEEVQRLAQLYGLDWERDRSQQLMTLVGGHPYLVQQAFYHVTQRNVNLETLQETAATESGIYSNHLQRYKQYLQQLPPEMTEIFKQAIAAEHPVELSTRVEKEQAQKLHHLGLLTVENRQAAPRFSLYRQYFRQSLALG